MELSSAVSMETCDCLRSSQSDHGAHSSHAGRRPTQAAKTELLCKPRVVQAVHGQLAPGGCCPEAAGTGLWDRNARLGPASETLEALRMLCPLLLLLHP